MKRGPQKHGVWGFTLEVCHKLLLTVVKIGEDVHPSTKFLPIPETMKNISNIVEEYFFII